MLRGPRSSRPFMRELRQAGSIRMHSSPRHQCLIYEGSRRGHLSALASIVADEVRRRRRCLGFLDPQALSAFRVTLSAADLDPQQATLDGHLTLTSDRPHLAAGRFDIARMMSTLHGELDRALADGYTGLFATGDMAWETGGLADAAMLLEYETRLDRLFRSRSQLHGICQYHAGGMEREMMRQSLLTHPSIFISERLSLPNAFYSETPSLPAKGVTAARLDAIVEHLVEMGASNVA